MERKIDFMIIGAQKAGSSSLHFYLSQHPNIFMPKLKDIQFFERDEYYKELDKVLNAIYADLKDEKVIGGSDVNLLYFYYAANRIYEYNPNIKLIVILRNPIDRAYSAYWAAVRDGFETAKTFEEALEKEPQRRNGTLRERGILTYLEHGHYDEQLEYYYKIFDKNQIYVILTEDLKNKPKATLLDILSWLNVETYIDNINFGKRENVASISKAVWLQRFLTKEGFYAKIYRRLPPNIRIALYEHVYLNFRKINSKPFKYPPMKLETREMLKEYFKPHILRVGKMIGRDLSFWLE